MRVGEGLGERSSGALFIVATPIGNLEDITLRALRVLKECDLIIAEDTRHSRKLLQHYGIEKSFERSLYRGVERERVEYFVQKLKSGAKIALISDAGTPLISDPGYELVRRAIAENISVVPIPGPTALITALVASGFSTDSFLFEGVPPKKLKAKRALFERLQNERRTIVLYESPHRVLDTLEVISERLPDRQIALCRELTKMHEEILRGKPSEILEQLKSRPAIKGEITLVLSSASVQEESEEASKDLELSVVEHVQKLVAGGLEKKEAIKRVAQLRRVPKREVYEKVVGKNARVRFLQ
ncbi:16S rRNA (cytidine(1402)-2'-O)-methyltransferase [Candidatus Acetothermia bacterium]|nr:16S rRNA (cytidine(1402)-2'-O)-methyltransferase [Candidatus Acetothermia bacterium]MCI2431915.1 16S rRNA (cytidine(1402)-2'-O)-methyltransferase [Candidatus Acetothermia bacterium]MCI2437352.1 16S rRNA (cytidine(1402)-2'-O)-methyltransferase [Candidatus Acetothermia bacterium]